MRLLNLQIKLNFLVIEPTWKISKGNKYVDINLNENLQKKNGLT